MHFKAVATDIAGPISRQTNALWLRKNVSNYEAEDLLEQHVY